jgi:hypothetical protein
LILAAAAEGREAVLVVDQLDAVSTTSGRSTSFLEAVEGLLIEARGLRDRLPLHYLIGEIHDRQTREGMVSCAVAVLL